MITGEVVNAILLTISHAKPAEAQMIRGIDVSLPKTVDEKKLALNFGELIEVKYKKANNYFLQGYEIV